MRSSAASSASAASTIVGGDEIDRFDRRGPRRARVHQGRARAPRAARRLRRRRDAGRDARQARRPRAGRQRRDPLRPAAAHQRRRASGPRATCASTRASSTTARGSASSTPTTPGTRAPTRHARCSVPRSPTTSCRTSSATSRTGLSLEYVGPARDWDEEIVAGSMESGEFGVWYLKDGRVLGALSVGGGIDLDRARELLRGRQQVEPDSLPLRAPLDVAAGDPVLFEVTVVLAPLGVRAGAGEADQALHDDAGRARRRRRSGRCRS